MAIKGFSKHISLLVIVFLALGIPLDVGRVHAGPARQDTPTVLEYGQTVDGEINETQPSLFYEFTAAADDVVTITMVVTNGDLDPFIVLNASDRTPLITDDNSGGERNARLTYVIPSAGRYIIQATHAGGIPPTGGGAFSLNLTAAIDGATPPAPEDIAAEASGPQDDSTRLFKLATGTTVRDSLTRQTALRLYWFAAQTGDQITITPEQAGGFQPLYVIYNADFDELARATGSEALRFSIPEDGVYFLSTSLPEASGSGGNFSFTSAYLPNPATAGNFIDITYGDSQRGNIDATISAVTYRFQGTQNDNVTIAMKRAGGDLNSYLYLLDSTGQLIFEDNDSGGTNGDALITYTLPESGTYLIVATRLGQAQGTTSGSYLLELQSDAAPLPVATTEATPEPTLPSEYSELPQITYGETVEGELSDAKFTDFYVFLGNAGDPITVEMLSPTIDTPTGLDPLLILLDENRIPLAENDDIVSEVERNARIEYTLPKTGYYAIVATRFEQDAGITSGPYTLTLMGPGGTSTATPESTDSQDTLLERLDAVRLLPGTPQQASFDQGAALYRFSAEAETLIDITTTTDPGLDVVAILADENLNEIASSGTGNLTGVTIPKHGQYLVLLTPRFGPAASSEGGYIVALTQTAETFATEVDTTETGPRVLAYGDSVNGTIDDETVSQVYTFTGESGERVRITMEATPESDLDCYLELQDTDGNLVEANDDIDPGVIRDSQIVSTLPAGGEYTIIASRYVDTDTPVTSGSYRLSLERLDENTVEGISEQTIPIQYEQTEVGEINDDQYLLFYVFDGMAGDVITIEVDHLSGNLDSVLYLYRSEGDSWALMTSNDDSPTGATYAPLLSDITLPQTSKYLIVISRYGMERETSFGTFSLTLTREE